MAQKFKICCAVRNKICCAVPYNLLCCTIQFAVLYHTICCAVPYNLLCCTIQFAVLYHTICSAVPYNLQCCTIQFCCAVPYNFAVLYHTICCAVPYNLLCCTKQNFHFKRSPSRPLVPVARSSHTTRPTLPHPGLGPCVVTLSWYSTLHTQDKTRYQRI